MNPLSDEDVDRIARRVAWKVILYGLLLVVAFWIAQLVIGLLSGLPLPAIVPLATSMLAVPAILLIWIWTRSKRSR